MGLTSKCISIITLLTYVSSDVGNNIKKDNFCLNYGRTEGYGCKSGRDTDSLECTLKAAMVGPALNKITNIHIKGLYICVDNRFTGNFSSEADKHIDIKPLQRFPDLLKFAIITFNSFSSYLFRLDHNGTTFEHMNQLEHFQINVPTDQHLTGIFDQMTSLQVLDLSNTLEIGLDKVLTWISKLPSRGLTEIKLQKVQIIGYINYAMSINVTDLFRNVTFENVTILDLSHNAVAIVYPGILSVVPNVENIDVSYNQIHTGSSVPMVFELMMSPKLHKLDIANQNCLEELPKYIPTFQDYDFTRNKTGLRSTEGSYSFLIGLPVACINDASKGNVSNFFSSGVRTCRFFNCFISRYVQNIPCSVFPPLSEVININNDCLLNINLPFFKNMKFLNMSNTDSFEYNYGYSFAGNNLCFGKNSLKELNVGYNSKLFYALQTAQFLGNMTFIGLNHLENLNLSGNAVNFDISRFCTSQQSFANSLKQIDLSHNRLKVTTNFQPCNSCARDLTYIDLSNNGLLEIPQGIFSACSSLVSASLKRNHLKFNETFLNLTDTTNLMELDLSENSIETLNPEFRKHLEDLAFLHHNQSRKIIINMESNPILCSCKEDVVEFIYWMQTTSVQFKNKDSYTCTGIDGIQQITRINFHQYKSKCFPSKFVTIFSTVLSTSGCMFMVCLVFLGYYKRFTVKYYIFRMHQLCQSCKQTTHTPHRNYKYDVFVSYCAEDRFWVHEVLMKQLEDVYKFKLCIHYRDFPAGGSISEVILKKLKQSCEIIFVLSDHFIFTLRQPDRPWFQFELDEACDLVRLRKKNIIVIKLGKITKPVSDRSLAYLLDGGNIFLEWPENPKGHKVFWAKLVSDLYSDTQGSCLSCCFNTRRGIGHRDVREYSRVDSSDEDNEESSNVVNMGDNGRYFSRETGSCCRCCRKPSTGGYLDDDSVITV